MRKQKGEFEKREWDWLLIFFDFNGEESQSLLLLKAWRNYDLTNTYLLLVAAIIKQELRFTKLYSNEGIVKYVWAFKTKKSHSTNVPKLPTSNAPSSSSSHLLDLRLFYDCKATKKNGKERNVKDLSSFGYRTSTSCRDHFPLAMNASNFLPCECL